LTQSPADARGTDRFSARFFFNPAEIPLLMCSPGIGERSWHFQVSTFKTSRIMPLATDLILTGGNLLTLDPARPRATAMAVREGRIVRVGHDREVEPLAGPETRRIDLGGRTVTPGFCDSHLHMFWYGLQLRRQCNLVGCTSIDELLERLVQHASGNPEQWIQGHGFDQSKLRERRFPGREELDRVAGSRPMIISRVCGHAVVVNSAALARVNEQERSAGDAQSGLYTEGSSSAFYRRIPPPDETEAEEAVLAATRVALKTGITSVHTLLDTPEQMGAYARLRRRGKLPIRVVGMPPYASVAALHAHGINSTFGDDWLRFGAAKLFSDGSLGAQTALLSEPYHDQPGTPGIRIHDPLELKRMARDAQARGFQLAIHAIGDQAVRETIDAIEHALEGEPAPAGGPANLYHRHRIEHVSMCPPDCLERMAKLKIVGILQPQFVTSDTWTAERIGPGRAAWAYNFKSLLKAQVPIALSSDCPVEQLDAFACLHSAVNRHEWSPDETLSIEEALHAYCLGSAYAAHGEDRLGSLEPGKLADFVILSDDPTRIHSSRLRSLQALEVYVGGQPASGSPDRTSAATVGSGPNA
jgi:predicted amidohydrolase YtcJ